jgi:hypothetical protein
MSTNARPAPSPTASDPLASAPVALPGGESPTAAGKVTTRGVLGNQTQYTEITVVSPVGGPNSSKPEAWWAIVREALAVPMELRIDEMQARCDLVAAAARDGWVGGHVETVTQQVEMRSKLAAR